MGFNRQKVLNAAQKYVTKGRLEKAIAEYQKVVKEKPDDDRTWLRIAELYERNGDVVKAAHTFERVAKLYRDGGFSTRATAVHKQLRRLIRKHPGKLADRCWVTTQSLVEIYMERDLKGDAFAALDDYVRSAEASGQTDHLVEAYEKLVELRPELFNAKLRLVELLRAGEKDQEANVMQRELGDELLRVGRRDEAIRVLDGLLGITKDVVLARQVARLYLDRGSQVDAMTALSRMQLCFQTTQRDMDTLSLLAEAFDAVGQGASALETRKLMVRIARDKGDGVEAAGILENMLQAHPGNDALRKLADSFPEGKVLLRRYEPPHIPQPKDVPAWEQSVPMPAAAATGPRTGGVATSSSSSMEIEVVIPEERSIEHSFEMLADDFVEVEEVVPELEPDEFEELEVEDFSEDDDVSFEDGIVDLLGAEMTDPAKTVGDFGSVDESFGVGQSDVPLAPDNGASYDDWTEGTRSGAHSVSVEPQMAPVASHRPGRTSAHGLKDEQTTTQAYTDRERKARVPPPSPRAPLRSWSNETGSHRAGVPSPPRPPHRGGTSETGSHRAGVPSPPRAPLRSWTSETGSHRAGVPSPPRAPLRSWTSETGDHPAGASPRPPSSARRPPRPLRQLTGSPKPPPSGLRRPSSGSNASGVPRAPRSAPSQSPDEAPRGLRRPSAPRVQRDVAQRSVTADATSPDSSTSTLVSRGVKAGDKARAQRSSPHPAAVEPAIQAGNSVLETTVTTSSIDAHWDPTGTHQIDPLNTTTTSTITDQVFEGSSPPSELPDAPDVPLDEATEEALEEADFFRSQGLLEDALSVLGDLEGEQARHPAVLEAVESIRKEMAG